MGYLRGFVRWMEPTYLLRGDTKTPHQLSITAKPATGFLAQAMICFLLQTQAGQKLRPDAYTSVAAVLTLASLLQPLMTPCVVDVQQALKEGSPSWSCGL